MKLIVTVYLIAVFSSAYAQDFEGTIEYEHQYNSDVLDVDSLRHGLSTKSIYLWKGADYKGIFNGDDSAIYLYKGEETKCYYSRRDLSPFYCELDYSLRTDSIIKYQILYDQEIILGEKCDLLIIHTPTSTTKYYFSKKYRVNPEYYKTHKAYLWDFYMEKAGGAVILMSITEYETYQITIVATAITRTSLPESDFYIRKILVVDCE